MKQYIKNLPIGTRVLYEYTSSEATMLGYYGGYAVIGWEEKPTNSVGSIGWHRTSPNFTTMVGNVDIREDFDKMNWFYWISKTSMVEVLEDKILNANQVCVGCNLPAPHASPNVGDKFICIACKFFADLDAVASGG